ncbi:MAG: ribonuclease P protein component [Luteibacter sp.]|uniref:ribonuclease P protein component n=1 Tax=Luteibacter TaxID=242605 RepID=UPI00069016EE|nr:MULTISPECIES: ribonuclease P protein component [unclassified Luteibacter]MDQ7995756.1 ribonuclease P protein component [Luteibacter sp.]MDQ8051267.1 ribonuclease P protein component [Luteibacter sp.]MDR6642458.1 ribonuclease P protein component [Luteibacter sp. 1214]
MRAAAMPRDARLRRAADFAALRTVSGRLGGRCFLLRFGNNDVDTARLGLAISKRCSKRAVDRNRIKRLAREAFRLARPDLPPVDILVMAKDIAVKETGAALLAELDTLLRRIRPLKRESADGTIAR